jgi:hypothetical protein
MCTLYSVQVLVRYYAIGTVLAHLSKFVLLSDPADLYSLGLRILPTTSKKKEEKPCF